MPSRTTPNGGAKIMIISIRHHVFCTKSIKTCIFLDYGKAKCMFLAHSEQLGVCHTLPKSRQRRHQKNPRMMLKSHPVMRCPRLKRLR